MDHTRARADGDVGVHVVDAVDGGTATGAGARAWNGATAGDRRLGLISSDGDHARGRGD